jgi:hypothetical protein
MGRDATQGAAEQFFAIAGRRRFEIMLHQLPDRITQDVGNRQHAAIHDMGLA